ncbi:hypothetical protein GCM10010435_48980 [Winogradskya consettensis]|uniref:Uncharacterized protein n=1 Tax=Winogradskya consettensis TaxID=113560 RepID=A0A919SKI8_9ACTN|nr:hypothetical protein [Actinoplanes consettensis]GIM73157.1 hypothetical protein Aco04nite_33910 [Actinoplanes consettensis]
MPRDQGRNPVARPLQAGTIPVLRRLLDGTRTFQPAAGNQVSASTGYIYPHESLTVPADRASGLNSALPAAV